MYIRGKQYGFTLIEISISIAVLAILSALAISALGNMFSHTQMRTAAIFFQDSSRQARYEARSRIGDVITFCAIADNNKNDSINCDTTEAYEHDWLWYSTDTDDKEILPGKNYTVSDSDVTVTPNINFLIEIQNSELTLSNKEDIGARSEITVPYSVGTDQTDPAITFIDSSNRSSVVVFYETARTRLKHS